MVKGVLKGQEWEIKLVGEKGRTEADIAQNNVWEGYTRKGIDELSS